jgi:hypothetical protein
VSPEAVAYIGILAYRRDSGAGVDVSQARAVPRAGLGSVPVGPQVIVRVRDRERPAFSFNVEPAFLKLDLRVG